MKCQGALLHVPNWDPWRVGICVTDIRYRFGPFWTEIHDCMFGLSTGDDFERKLFY